MKIFGQVIRPSLALSFIGALVLGVFVFGGVITPKDISSLAISLQTGLSPTDFESGDLRQSLNSNHSPVSSPTPGQPGPVILAINPPPPGQVSILQIASSPDGSLRIIGISLGIRVEVPPEKGNRPKKGGGAI